MRWTKQSTLRYMYSTKIIIIIIIIITKNYNYKYTYVPITNNLYKMKSRGSPTLKFLTLCGLGADT